VKETKIELIRSDSLGIVGTWRNAEHHAEAIEPFIKAMQDVVVHLGFAVWRQGHNVHEFITEEGTRYTLRAFGNKSGYIGIRLALRLSRSSEIRLIDITNIDEVWRLVDTMRLLARPAQGGSSGLIPEPKAA
jgi:hypothetical protein